MKNRIHCINYLLVFIIAGVILLIDSTNSFAVRKYEVPVYDESSYRRKFIMNYDDDITEIRAFIGSIKADLDVKDLVDLKNILLKIQKLVRNEKKDTFYLDVEMGTFNYGHYKAHVFYDNKFRKGKEIKILVRRYAFGGIPEEYSYYIDRSYINLIVESIEQIEQLAYIRKTKGIQEQKQLTRKVESIETKVSTIEEEIVRLKKKKPDEKSTADRKREEELKKQLEEQKRQEAEAQKKLAQKKQAEQKALRELAKKREAEQEALRRLAEQREAEQKALEDLAQKRESEQESLRRLAQQKEIEQEAQDNRKREQEIEEKIKAQLKRQKEIENEIQRKLERQQAVEQKIREQQKREAEIEKELQKKLAMEEKVEKELQEKISQQKKIEEKTKQQLARQQEEEVKMKQRLAAQSKEREKIQKRLDASYGEEVRVKINRPQYQGKGGSEEVRDSGETCYKIGYRIGKCRMKKEKGLTCKKENDIQPPERCTIWPESNRLESGISDATKNYQ